MRCLSEKRERERRVTAFFMFFLLLPGGMWAWRCTSGFRLLPVGVDTRACLFDATDDLLLLPATDDRLLLLLGVDGAPRRMKKNERGQKKALGNSLGVR